jgi:antibiotic biosynthesis monooxygenase (ABM) superfamily enzyme
MISSPTSQPGAPVQPSSSPVKIVIERRARPGAEDSFRGWAERFVAEASRWPGHEGGSVLSAAGSGSYVILLRFESGTALDGWQRSPTYEALIREADQVSNPGEASQIQSGLETWFTLPGMPAPAKPPPRWKMAIVTWLALLPMVIALGYAFTPLRLPFLLQAAVSTAIPVAMLTWVIMPRVTRVLYRWLYAN